VISFTAFTSYRLENEKRTLKTDLIELSDIKYGMVNIDKWEEQFAEIITKKLKDLKLTGADKEEARTKVQAFLHEAIDKFETSYKAENDRKADFSSVRRNFSKDRLYNV